MLVKAVVYPPKDSDGLEVCLLIASKPNTILTKSKQKFAPKDIDVMYEFPTVTIPREIFERLKFVPPSEDPRRYIKRKLDIDYIKANQVSDFRYPTVRSNRSPPKIEPNQF